MKQSPSVPYQCVNSAAVAAQINIDPSATFEGAGGSTTFTPARAKVVQGVLCNGYTFTLTTSAGARVHGMLYVNPSNGRLREEDATTTIKSTTTGKNVPATTVAIWSNYNSSALTIPTVPAA